MIQYSSNFNWTGYQSWYEFYTALIFAARDQPQVKSTYCTSNTLVTIQQVQFTVAVHRKANVTCKLHWRHVTSTQVYKFRPQTSKISLGNKLWHAEDGLVQYEPSLKFVSENAHSRTQRICHIPCRMWIQRKRGIGRDTKTYVERTDVQQFAITRFLFPLVEQPKLLDYTRPIGFCSSMERCRSILQEKRELYILKLLLMANEYT